MTKLWIVLKREYLLVVKKKSFLIGLVLTPILMAGFMVVPAMLARTESSSAEPLAVIDRSGLGVGDRFAEALAEYKLEDSDDPYYDVQEVFNLSYSEESRFESLHDSLSREISDKALKYYLVVNPDPQVVDTNLYLVTNSDNFVTYKRFRGTLSDILSAIRLENSDINLSVDSVLHLTHRTDLAVKDTKGEETPFEIKYFAGIIFVMIIFMMIFYNGQLIMRSVIEEKNSRVMEVLISSVSPFQLMLGKVFGLGAATITQMAIWLGIGGTLYLMRGALEINPAIDRIVFNPVIVVFFVLFLIVGYLLYATLFALIGSLVNSDREAQNFVAPISMLLVLPMIIALHVVQEPNSTLSTTLSFIPLLTPTLMMLRVIFVAPTLTEYSLFSGIVGEAALGFLVAAASTVLMTWLSARIFRIGILMYGKRPTLPEILKWIRY